MCTACAPILIDPPLRFVVIATGHVRHSAHRRGTKVALLALACLIGGVWRAVGVAVALIILIVLLQLLKKVGLIRWRDGLKPQLPSIVLSEVMLFFLVLLNAVLRKLSLYNIHDARFGASYAGTVVNSGTLYFMNHSESLELKQEAFREIGSVRKNYHSTTQLWSSFPFGREMT